MRLLTKDVNYESTIKLAKELNGEYEKSVIFHCYWHGNLNEKHLYSILSFYFFNVLRNENKHKIILWIENNCENNFNNEIMKYAEIKQFSYDNEIQNTFLKHYQYNPPQLTFKSDFIRSLLLFKYGGCWFDLDCFCLRCFDPLFCNFKDDICLYQWENKNYPNNAIYISLIPRSKVMKANIQKIINIGRGWGFKAARLTFNQDIDVLVLPCSWFDGSWIKNPYNLRLKSFLKKTQKSYNFDNFFNGSFCHHWHNDWNFPLDDTSIIKQLTNIIYSQM